MTRSGAAPLPRRSPKGDRRRKEPVDIAARLFTAEGLERPSLQDIADQAQLANAAVPCHFPDKAGPHEAVVVGRLAESRAQAPAAVDLAGSPPEKIRASARRIDEDRTGWPAASHLTRSLGVQNRTPAIVAARDRPERLPRALIEDAVEASPVDPAMLSRLIFPAINRIPCRRRPEGRLSSRRVANQHLGMIVEGARATRSSGWISTSRQLAARMDR